ncbi:MAG TPA: SymE family type I addiction module toxin [Thermoanaerobaculia bacterium]|nr:SymE family type I addiction module toxin [Thermoanaerobaculia bacterium]
MTRTQRHSEEANVISRKKTSVAAGRPFGIPDYRRPSRRGGRGGKRELVVAAMYRGDGEHRRGRKFVPYIRMSGVWLQQLGFRRGDRIEITAENERIVLTVVRDDG